MTDARTDEELCAEANHWSGYLLDREMHVASDMLFELAGRLRERNKRIAELEGREKEVWAENAVLRVRLGEKETEVKNLRAEQRELHIEVLQRFGIKPPEDR